MIILLYISTMAITMAVIALSASIVTEVSPFWIAVIEAIGLIIYGLAINDLPFFSTFIYLYHG